MSDDEEEIVHPLVVLFNSDGGVMCHMNPPNDVTPKEWAVLTANLIIGSAQMLNITLDEMVRLTLAEIREPSGKYRKIGWVTDDDDTTH